MYLCMYVSVYTYILMCVCVCIYISNLYYTHVGFSGSSAGKESSCNAGDLGLNPGLESSPGDGIGYPLQYSWASLMAQMAKNTLAVWKSWVLSLDWKDPLEEGMPLLSSILAWRIPMDRETWWATVHGVAKSQTQLSE